MAHTQAVSGLAGLTWMAAMRSLCASPRWVQLSPPSVLRYTEDLKWVAAFLPYGTLQFEKGTGYLRSVLRALQIPVESQMLVFSPTSLQADVYESLVAAIYLDGGLEAARAFILKYVGPEIEAVSAKIVDKVTKATGGSLRG